MTTDYETERVARAIARVHFSRKQWPTWGDRDARIAHAVERNWRNHVDHAKAALAAQDDGFSGSIAEKAMLKTLLQSFQRLLWLAVKQAGPGGVRIERPTLEDFDPFRARIKTRVDLVTGDHFIEADVTPSP